MTDAGVKDLISGSPGLHKISLYWNVHITDAVLLKLSTSCPKLTHLNLSGCKRITDKGLMAVARKCPELVDVDLTRHASQCHKIGLSRDYLAFVCTCITCMMGFITNGSHCQSCITSAYDFVSAVVAIHLAMLD